MKHIKITNAKTGRTIEHDLTDDFIDFFIQDRTEKKKFGEPERWIPISLATEFEISREDNRRSTEVLPGEVLTEIHVPNDFSIEITDITLEYEAEQRRQNQINEGKNSRLCCEEIIDLIGGYNLSRAFTSSEINQLLVEFSSINSYLKNFMPRSAKPLIESSPISSTLTQQLKDDIVAIFTKYSI
jgi:hypothetical protein